MSSAAEAIERELALVQEMAGAPRPVRLGCTMVSHDRLGFCSACEPQPNPGSVHLELMGWRLLALRKDGEQR